MRALVEDVEAYPAFLPWCGGSAVISRDDTVTVASVTIHFHGVRQTFTTRNTRIDDGHIQIALVDGPFRKLEGGWYFRPVGDEGCRVDLQLDYEFSSRLLERLIGPVFARIADSLVDAFVERADQLDAAGA